MTLVAVSDEHGFSYNRALGTIYRGWALTGSGQIPEGIALLRAGVAEYRSNRSGDVCSLPSHIARRRREQGEVSGTRGWAISPRPSG